MAYAAIAEEVLLEINQKGAERFQEEVVNCASALVRRDMETFVLYASGVYFEAGKAAGMEVITAEYHTEAGLERQWLPQQGGSGCGCVGPRHDEGGEGGLGGRPQQRR